MARTALFRVVFAAAAASILSLPGCSEQRSPLSLRESGIDSASRYDYAAGARDLQQYLDANPADSRARFYYGKCLLGLGRPAEAREQLEIAHTANLEDDDVFDALCEALYADRQYDDLFVRLRQRTTDRGLPRDYIRLARFCIKSRDMDEAHAALLTAARLDRARNSEPYLALSDFHAVLGDDAGALENLRIAYHINPRDQQVLARVHDRNLTPGPGFGIPPPK